jgi:hypothetical protein
LNEIGIDEAVLQVRQWAVQTPFGLVFLVKSALVILDNQSFAVIQPFLMSYEPRLKSLTR